VSKTRHGVATDTIEDEPGSNDNAGTTLLLFMINSNEAAAWTDSSSPSMNLETPTKAIACACRLSGRHGSFV
jgi:hypothetical protein